MAIITVFDSDMPLNSSLDILLEHFKSLFDGATHGGIIFPDSEIFLEERELEKLLPLQKPFIRIQVFNGRELDKINGNDEARTIRQEMDALISVGVSRDTGGAKHSGRGELTSSEMKDFVKSGALHKFVAFLEKAGLSEFDVGIPITIPHPQLWLWNMTAIFVVEIAQNLVDPG